MSSRTRAKRPRGRASASPENATERNVAGESPKTQIRDLWKPGALVFGVALVLRLLHLWELRRAPFFELLVGDAAAYDAWAKRIAGGDWWGSEVFYQAPLYPYLLGAWYAVAGPGLLALRVAQAVLGSLAAAITTFGAGKLFGRVAGLVSGLLLALHGPSIFFDALVQKAVLDALLVALLVLLLALLLERETRARSAGVGLVLGFLALSRENALVLLPVVALWLGLRARRAWAPVLFCIAGATAALAPVAIRNFAVGGELLVTTSQLGPNLYIGNHEGATGSYVPLRPGRGSATYERRDAVELAERELGRALTAGEVSRFWRDRALAWVAEHPGAWFRLLGKKLLLAWNGDEAMDTEALETHAEWSAPLRWTARLDHFGVLAPLALLGLWWTRRRWRELWVFHAAIAAYLAGLVAFYVVARYRYPLVPLLVPFAGSAVVQLPGRWRSGSRRDRLGAAALLAAGALVTNWTLLPVRELRALTHFNYGREFETRGDLEAARAQYARVLELDPRNSRAHTNLGVLEAAKGRRKEALGHFRAAAEGAPGEARNQLNLGVELITQGQLSEALLRFERARELDPLDAGVRFNLGSALAAAGRNDEAIRELEEACRLDPRDPRILNNLGILLATAGRPEEAVPRFEAALRLDPGFRDAAANLDRARALLAGSPR